MLNHFYYTKVHVSSPEKEGDKPRVTFLPNCSFPLDKVLQTITLPNGTRAIILDDGHEETKVYQTRDKNGKPIEERYREYVRTEIILSPEDGERYRLITEVTPKDAFWEKVYDGVERVDERRTRLEELLNPPRKEPQDPNPPSEVESLPEDKPQEEQVEEIKNPE